MFVEAIWGLVYYQVYRLKLKWDKNIKACPSLIILSFLIIGKCLRLLTPTVRSQFGEIKKYWKMSKNLLQDTPWAKKAHISCVLFILLEQEMPILLYIHKIRLRINLMYMPVIPWAKAVKKPHHLSPLRLPCDNHAKRLMWTKIQWHLKPNCLAYSI